MNDSITINLPVEHITRNGVKINGLNHICSSRNVHYLIYKITNLVNGKYYYGQHVTPNPLDDYMGSGLMLEHAKAKYGIENFVKTILYDFSSREEMNQKETSILPIEECYHSNPMCYNLATGGKGGYLGPEVAAKISVATSGEKNGMYGKKLSKETLQKISDKLRGHPNYTHKGWHQTDDAKRRISEKHKGMLQTDESKRKIREARARQTNLVLDSAKDKRWYYNPVTNEEGMFYDADAPVGWILGRPMQPTRGMKYYNNGETDILLREGDTVPIGFVPGRHTKPVYTEERNRRISEKLKGRPKDSEYRAKISASIKGRMWFNNGHENVLARECPEGWTRGRIERREP